MRERLGRSSFLCVLGSLVFVDLGATLTFSNFGRGGAPLLLHGEIAGDLPQTGDQGLQALLRRVGLPRVDGQVGCVDYAAW